MTIPQHPSLTVLLLCCLAAGGCDRWASDPEPAAAGISQSPEDTAEHGHRSGVAGGVIASLGRDEYHTEAVLQSGGVLALYTLGADETRIHEVARQVLSAYVQPHGESESWIMVLRPDPLPSDSASKTSRFTGELPEQVIGRPFRVTVPGLRIDGERFTVRFDSPRASAEPTMPAPRADDEQRELYLTPGGLYTAADIAANGTTTAAQKYAGFRAEHDLDPQPGELLCPITQTKANPECRWVVGGKSYQFCCPPCIDEFVARAKTTPDEVRDPEEYVQAK